MKPSFWPLNQLSRKLILGVVFILLFVLVGTLFVNAQLVGKVYLHQQQAYVQQIGDRLTAELENGSSPRQAIQTIEEQENVLVAYSQETDDPDALAWELREIFRQKGLGFQTFWLWDQDYSAAMQNGSQFRLYSQSKMNYSILVQYLPLESGLYAIAAIVPHAQGLIAVVNRMGFLVNSLGILIAIGLIVVLTRHITKPLADVRAFAQRVSDRECVPLQIHTGDELEEVADSLNQMACSIRRYQERLEEKNEQMQRLLRDVAHELKTPISLVGMYGEGIRDGLDDGTFLDTILQQNEKMSQIVQKLLHLSRMDQKEIPCEPLRLDQLLLWSLQEHQLLFDQRGLKIRQTVEPDLLFTGNRELLSELFSNFLSNAAKYAAPEWVTVSLTRQDSTYLFRISNYTDNAELDCSQIWQPFWVGEKSRNKERSGTGLGLSIVKKIADQFHCTVSCSLNGRELSFQVFFPTE